LLEFDEGDTIAPLLIIIIAKIFLTRLFWALQDNDQGEVSFISNNPFLISPTLTAHISKDH